MRYRAQIHLAKDRQCDVRAIWAKMDTAKPSGPSQETRVNPFSTNIVNGGYQSHLDVDAPRWTMEDQGHALRIGFFSIDSWVSGLLCPVQTVLLFFISVGGVCMCELMLCR